jgi:hypothetical protein
MSAMKVLKILILLLALSRNSSALEVTDISEIGPHHRILTLEKNENPENVLAVYTQVDSSCRVGKKNSTASSDIPHFGFYWLMNRMNYKPVHPLIRQGIAQRITVLPEANSSSFHVKLEDLKEMKTDLEDLRLNVIARLEGARCKVGAFMNLGPSDHHAKMKLELIDSQSKKTILPPFRKVLSVTLKGVLTATGEKFSRTYYSR